MSGSKLGASLLGVWIILLELSGSKLVKLYVCVRELHPMHVRELSGKCLK